MSLDLKARWRELGFASRDALAREVCTLWGDPKQQPRNVSIKLAELERQKTIWWDKRPEGVRALASALEVEQEDILRPRQAGTTVLPFQDFPAARGFDTTRDQVCALGNEGWFDPRPKGGRWILAPPGTGKSLVAHVHRRKHGMRVERAASLAEARHHAVEPGSLVIEIERPSDDDRAIEQDLLARGEVVVLAPFPPWAQRNASSKSDEWKRPPVSDGPQWPEVFPWTPMKGWRATFVEWLINRVEGGVRFNVKELLEWLEHEDPQARLFSTPGDMVLLCAFAHDVGTRAWRKLARHQLVGLWLKRRLNAEGTPTSSRELWLGSQGSETTRALIQRWFEGSDPWLGALTKERWLELLPHVRIPPERAEVKRQLEELLRTRSRKDLDQKLEEVLDTLASTQEGDAFLYLASARLFHPEGAGLWRFGSPWVGNLIAQELVLDALRNRPPEDWGRWTVQPDRRGLIDALQDELGNEELVSLAEQCVSRFHTGSLGSTGAIESVFAALGRRMLRGERFPEAKLRRLGELQSQLILNRSPGPAPAPLTRHGPWDGPPDAVSWIAICWAWSVSVQARAPWEELEWLFPGWTTPLLARAPSWLMSGRTVQLPAQIAEQIVARCADTALPDTVPDMLLPACIKTAAHRGWRLMDSHFDSLMRHPEALTPLLEEMKGQPLENKQALAGRFWKAAQRNGSNFYARQPSEALRLFVEEHLLIEDFCANLTNAQLSQYLSGKAFTYVPSRLRPHVIRECIARKLPVGTDLLDLRSELVDAECLELLLGGGIEPVWLITRAFWQRLPERALEMAQQSLQGENKDASAWFGEAPQHAVPRLLGLLESHAPARAAWIEQWLGWHLAKGGHLVERLHQMLLRFRSRPANSS